MSPFSSFSMPCLSTLTQCALSFIALLIFVEQFLYLLKKRHAPGPSFVLPFLGSAISLVANPTKFWDTQAALCSKHGFSVNYIVGKFVVFLRDSDLSHLVFANVRPDAFMVVIHPFGKKLFGDHNIMYMFGQDHKDTRRRIAPNFTPKALSTYTRLQQIIVLKHLKKWVSLAAENPNQPISLRLLARDLNLETSQTVFVGPYLSQEAREEVNRDYNLFNVGVMTLPIDLPGFAFRSGRLAIGRLIRALTECTRRSKERMRRGEEPACLVDFWMQETLREIDAADAAGLQTPTYTSDADIGSFLFDFLFAAQDASTSSLLWAVSLLESHPEVLSRVREEVARIWSPESGDPIGGEQLREMRYTQAVAREIIRYRAPATLVPHMAVEDFQLTASFKIPKGSLVFPSVFESSFQGFSEPDRFDPDRFSKERQEDQAFKKNFLAFGAGAHQCVGQSYALNYLVLFIAMFSTLLDFKRHRTDDCDEIVYNPTICPKDGCSVFLSRRCA